MLIAVFLIWWQLFLLWPQLFNHFYHLLHHFSIWNVSELSSLQLRCIVRGQLLLAVDCYCCHVDGVVFARSCFRTLDVCITYSSVVGVEVPSSWKSDSSQEILRRRGGSGGGERERKMEMFICIYMYVYVNVYIHVYMYILIHTYVCTYTYIHIYKYARTYISLKSFLSLFLFHTHTAVTCK